MDIKIEVLEKIDQDTYRRFGFNPQSSYHFQVDLSKLDYLEMGCFNRLCGISGATGVADINYNPQWIAIKANGQDFTVDNDKYATWSAFILWRKK